jgi:chromosome segregation ATPase
MQRVRAAVKDLLRVELLLIEADSELAALEERNRDVIRLLEEKKNENDALRAERERLGDVARKHRVRSEEIKASVPDDVRAIFEDFFYNRVPRPTPDELEAETTSTRQRIELVSPGDPRVLAEYEERAKKIEEHEAQLAKLEADAEARDARIAVLRGRWEPRLDRLVKRISAAFAHNFAQIRCAGEVSVQKEDEFDKWAILIHVRFRCGFLAVVAPPLSKPN